MLGLNKILAQKIDFHQQNLDFIWYFVYARVEPNFSTKNWFSSAKSGFLPSLAQLNPTPIQLSWLGWDSFNFNFYPPTPPHPQEKYQKSNFNTVIGQI